MEDFGGHIVVAMECGWGGAPRPFYRLSGDDDVSKRRSLSVGQCILQIGECIGAQVSGGNQDCRGGDEIKGFPTACDVDTRWGGWDDDGVGDFQGSIDGRGVAWWAVDDSDPSTVFVGLQRTCINWKYGEGERVFGFFSNSCPVGG